MAKGVKFNQNQKEEGCESYQYQPTQGQLNIGSTYLQ